MNEGVPETVDLDDPWSGSTEPPQTGVPELDQVIRAVADLDDRSVDGHVLALESAQVTLRKALDRPRDVD